MPFGLELEVEVRHWCSTGRESRYIKILETSGDLHLKTHRSGRRYWRPLWEKMGRWKIDGWIDVHCPVKRLGLKRLGQLFRKEKFTKIREDVCSGVGSCSRHQPLFQKAARDDDVLYLTRPLINFCHPCIPIESLYCVVFNITITAVYLDRISRMFHSDL